MVWYSYLFKNFPQFVVIHTVTPANRLGFLCIIFYLVGLVTYRGWF